MDSGNLYIMSKLPKIPDFKKLEEAPEWFTVREIHKILDAISAKTSFKVAANDGAPGEKPDTSIFQMTYRGKKWHLPQEALMLSSTAGQYLKQVDEYGIADPNTRTKFARAYAGYFMESLPLDKNSAQYKAIYATVQQRLYGPERLNTLKL